MPRDHRGHSVSLDRNPFCHFNGEMFEIIGRPLFVTIISCSLARFFHNWAVLPLNSLTLRNFILHLNCYPIAYTICSPGRSASAEPGRGNDSIEIHNLTQMAEKLWKNWFIRYEDGRDETRPSTFRGKTHVAGCGGTRFTCPEPAERIVSRQYFHTFWGLTKITKKKLHEHMN